MSVFDQFKAALDRKIAKGADNNWGIYLYPFGARGLHAVRNECNEEVKIVAGPKATFAPGTIVAVGSHMGNRAEGEYILSSPPPGRRGGATFGQVFPVPGTFDAVGITSASPATLDAGVSNQAVTLTGYGFRQTPLDDIEAVVWSEASAAYIADSLVTIHTLAWVSATSVTCLIDVSASAPDGYLVNVRVQRSAS